MKLEFCILTFVNALSKFQSQNSNCLPESSTFGLLLSISIFVFYTQFVSVINGPKEIEIEFESLFSSSHLNLWFVQDTRLHSFSIYTVTPHRQDPRSDLHPKHGVHARKNMYYCCTHL